MRSILAIGLCFVSLQLNANAFTIDITDNLVLQAPMKARYFPSINRFVVIDNNTIFIKNNLYTPWVPLRIDELPNKKIHDITYNKRLQIFIVHTDDTQFIFDQEFNFIEAKPNPYIKFKRQSFEEDDLYSLLIKDNKILFSSSLPKREFIHEKVTRPILMIDKLLQSLKYYPYMPRIQLGAVYRYANGSSEDRAQSSNFYSGSLNAVWNLNGSEVNKRRELLKLRKKYHEVLSAYHK